MAAYIKQNNTLARFLIILAAGLFFIAISYFLTLIFPVEARMVTPGDWVFGVDWKEFIGPDVRLLLAGGNPYAPDGQSVSGLYPPWAYLFLAPLALVSPGIGAVLIFTLTYFSFAFILFRLKYRPGFIVVFLCSLYIYRCAWSANIDWLAALGFILPSWLGLIFIMIKPQVGFGIALFWLVQAWQRERLRGVIKTFAPVTVLYLLSFLFFGLWPLRMSQMPQYALSNYPITLALGLLLLYKGIKDHKVQYAIASGPLLAPYANIYTYTMTLFAFDAPLPLAVLVFLTWMNY